MALQIKNTMYEHGDDDIEVGDLVEIIDEKKQGEVLTKVAFLYQIKTSDGINSYHRDEFFKLPNKDKD